MKPGPLLLFWLVTCESPTRTHKTKGPCERTPSGFWNSTDVGVCEFGDGWRRPKKELVAETPVLDMVWVRLLRRKSWYPFRITAAASTATRSLRRRSRRRRWRSLWEPLAQLLLLVSKSPHPSQYVHLSCPPSLSISVRYGCMTQIAFGKLPGFMWFLFIFHIMHTWLIKTQITNSWSFGRMCASVKLTPIVLTKSEDFKQLPSQAIHWLSDMTNSLVLYVCSCPRGPRPQQDRSLLADSSRICMIDFMRSPVIASKN